MEKNNTPTKKINGITWELHGMFCLLCNTHMGEMYNDIHGWKDTHNFKPYGDNVCSTCGQKYRYEEGDMICLDAEQIALLRKHKGEYHD